MILAFSYKDMNGKYCEPEKVTQIGEKFFAQQQELTQQIEKMS